jgi:hypothetical protein
MYRVIFLFLPLLSGQQATTTFRASSDDLASIRAKIDKIDSAVRAARAKHVDEDLIADVDVYGKAGRWVLEFPEDFFVADDVKHTLAILTPASNVPNNCKPEARPGWSAKANESTATTRLSTGRCNPMP